ncbi:hypothetical protein D9615_008378 [Tricholomella constricta]|uniref:Uncharacterized protein n=1 Tax=Tricholomella constricta TaxID=117010 RepID=A0A8H5M4V3_9AGAR|nr:hypothetical protein D9615_008378 [Tricholomella constricta]
MPKASGKKRASSPNPLWSRLRQQQSRSNNLTSFFPHPAPGEMRDMPYPLNTYGGLVEPNMIWYHIRKYKFPSPRCFHNIEARTFVVASGAYKGCAMAACGQKAKYGPRCPFWLNFTRIAQHGHALLTRQYELKDTPETGDENVGAGSSDHVKSDNEEETDMDNKLDSSDNEEDIQHGISRSLLDFYGGVFLENGLLNPYRHEYSHLRMKGSSPSDDLATSTASPSSAPPAYSSPHQGTMSRYSLARPSPGPNRGYAAALDPRAHTDLPIRHSTPERGNLSAVVALDSEEGLPADIFWTMFVLCRGCRHIMTGSNYGDHVCDLTM